jgi:hypothetical protein
MTILFILIFIFAFQGIRTLAALFSSLHFFKKNQKIIAYKEIGTEIRFFIFIPCLSEQKNIRATLAYFQDICKSLRGICSIYTVTTGKEVKLENTDTTWDVIASEILNKNYTNVYNIHDPYEKGFVSHQLNYAINDLKEKNLINPSDYIVVYNADSRPHPNTFNWVLNDIQKNGPVVYQQLSTVFKNFDDFGNSFGGLLLKTFAVLQTRFSFVHELPRLRRTISTHSFTREYSNAHCITHGLFIPYNTFENLGKFSENTMTEDLFLGFLIRATGNQIQPIPYLENIDSPTNIWKNMRQKYIWYWGPMNYPYYYLQYTKNFLGNKNSIKAFVLMLQGLFSAVAWALSGPLLLYGLVVGILSIDLLLGKILILLIVIYAPVQYFIILYKFKEILEYTTHKNTHSRKIIELIVIPVISFFVIIISSLPPYWSMCMEVYRIAFGAVLQKPKTES